MYYRMKREKQTMISLATQLLKVEVAAKDLEDLILIPHHSQTYLKIFLETLVQEDLQEDLVIEETI